MRTSLKLMTGILGLVLVAGIVGCKKDKTEEQAVIEVTIINVGFTSWKVVSVSSGANFAILETNNTPFTFETNRRYRIVSQANATVHPFEFRDASNNVLLSQNDAVPGSLSGNASINFVKEANAISFTMSSALATAISTYNCANHNGMRGNVVVE